MLNGEKKRSDEKIGDVIMKILLKKIKACLISNPLK